MALYRDVTNKENRVPSPASLASFGRDVWQGMDMPAVAEVSFSSHDRVRDVPHNFNLDGFDTLYPRHAGGRPPTGCLMRR
jgi:hypothetical protein